MAEIEEEEAENEQKVAKKDKKKDYLTDYEYEIGKLRRDMEDFKDKIIERIMEIKAEIKSIKASNNASGTRLKGYTIKELMGLKQLGINPKDLLMGSAIDSDEKTQN